MTSPPRIISKFSLLFSDSNWLMSFGTLAWQSRVTLQRKINIISPKIWAAERFKELTWESVHPILWVRGKGIWASHILQPESSVRQESASSHWILWAGHAHLKSGCLYHTLQCAEPHSCTCRVQVFQKAWAVPISSLYQRHSVSGNSVKLKMKWICLAS